MVQKSACVLVESCRDRIVNVFRLRRPLHSRLQHLDRMPMLLLQFRMACSWYFCVHSSPAHPSSS